MEQVHSKWLGHRTGRSELEEVHIDVTEPRVFQNLQVLVVEHLLFQICLSFVFAVTLFLFFMSILRYIATSFLFDLTASLIA